MALPPVTRWPAEALVGLVRGYQRWISPLSPPTCRFTPTCSQYAVEALREFGLVRGTVLATWRILRCAPWGGHGHDAPAWPPPGLRAGDPEHLG